MASEIVSYSQHGHKIRFSNNLLHCVRTCCYRISMQRAARLLSHLFRISNRRYAFNFICPLPNNSYLSLSLSLPSSLIPSFTVSFQPWNLQFFSFPVFQFFSFSVPSCPKIGQTTEVTNLWNLSHQYSKKISKRKISLWFLNQILIVLFVLTYISRQLRCTLKFQISTLKILLQKEFARTTKSRTQRIHSSFKLQFTYIIYSCLNSFIRQLDSFKIWRNVFLV